MSARIPLLISLAMLLTLAAPAVGQQTPGELLQSALYKQQVEGDLEGAVKIFEGLAEDFPQRREIAARALVQLGQAYETMGNVEALRIYERVLSDYPDQTDTAEEARQRLASLGPSTPGTAETGTVARLIWSGPGTDNSATPSPDGTRLWTTSGGIAIRDVATGEMSRSTTVGDASAGMSTTPGWPRSVSRRVRILPASFVPSASRKNRMAPKITIATSSSIDS